MKKPYIVLYIIIYILCAALLTGCAAPVRAQDTTLFAMDTVMNLRIYGDDGSAAAELSELIVGLDAALGATDAHSALYALNETGRSDDPTVCQMLALALAFCEETGGAVDPTVYPLVRLWGFPTGEYRVPSAQEIAAALECTGTDKLRLEDGAVTLADGAALDFGAFAKGWAGELCRDALLARGLNGILTLGGNIQTVGAKPDGSDWAVGVADPDDPAGYVLTLRLKGSCAVVTSGDYQRYFEDGGVRYCHILDPQTGRPAESGLRSVTVVCESGARADALSTALFVMGLDRAAEFWRKAGDFEAVFIDDTGAIYVTEGLANAASGEFSVLPKEAAPT